MFLNMELTFSTPHKVDVNREKGLGKKYNESANTISGWWRRESGMIFFFLVLWSSKYSIVRLYFL